MSQRNFIISLFVTVVLSTSVTYTITKWLSQSGAQNKPDEVRSIEQPPANGVYCEMELLHEPQYQKIRPLLFVDNKCESDELTALKVALTEEVTSKMKLGEISRAAVYFRDLNHALWTTVNGHEEFHPASMLKLVIMMNVLKQAELNPNILFNKVMLDKNEKLAETIEPSEQLIPCREYSVMELLQAMMMRSDHDATTLLFDFVDKDSYSEMFKNLNVKLPEEQDFFYSISPIDFSKFYRLLYHASYLNRNASEHALKLMEGSEFHGGLQLNLPNEASLIHKFGERKTKDGLFQFHDSGIVYYKGNAYLLIVMTEGQNIDDLKKVVPDLSNVCYDFIRNNESLN